jgi:hypothetical protein
MSRLPTNSRGLTPYERAVRDLVTKVDRLEQDQRRTQSSLSSLQSADKDSGSGVNTATTAFNFGTVTSKPTYYKRQTVSASWMKSTSIMSASFVGNGAEDAAVQEMTVTCTNLQNGQCDVIVVAPNGATGTYSVHIVGA